MKVSGVVPANVADSGRVRLGLASPTFPPVRMAPAEVKRVHDAFATAFATADVREAMTKQGNTIGISTTDYANQFFRSELAKYAKLVKKTGIELQ